MQYDSGNSGCSWWKEGCGTQPPLTKWTATNWSTVLGKKKIKNKNTTNAQGNTAVQIYSRHPEEGQVSSRDALYMVLVPTLVNLTVRQAFVCISNNTLPSCSPPLCTSQIWCRWHVPLLRVIWAEEAKFVVASCFLWSATHGLAPVAKLLLGMFQGGEMSFEVLPSHLTHSSTC